MPRAGLSSQVATEMQALWRRDLGITSIHLRGQEWKVYLNSQQLIDFDLCLSAWIGDYNDPQTFIDMFVTDGGNNDTGWAIRSTTRCWQTSENTADPAKRMQILHDMEKILVEDEVPIVPVYFWVGMSLYYPGQAGRLRAEFCRRPPLGRILYSGDEKQPCHDRDYSPALAPGVPVLFIVSSR
jgi:oligopeptide transport system substrate-binding protein